MVKWTEHAKRQLRQLHDYIALDSPIYAKRVAEALVGKTLALSELPHLGRVVPELNDESIRELSVYSYRILYEVKSMQVNVLAIIHKRRDLHSDEIPREKGDPL